MYFGLKLIKDQEQRRNGKAYPASPACFGSRLSNLDTNVKNPEEQFLPLSTEFCYLMLDFYVKTGIRFSLRDKRLFEITEVEIMRVDCIMVFYLPCMLKRFLGIRSSISQKLTLFCPH